MATITLYAGKLNQMPSLIGGMKQSVESYQAELQKLRQKTLSVDSSICDLSGVLAEIQTSTQIEEERVRALDSFKKQTEEFAADVVRIDGEVADMVNRTKEIFYDEYSYLRPEFEKSGWEKFCDGLQSAWKWCKERWKEVFSLLTAVRVAPSGWLLDYYLTFRNNYMVASAAEIFFLNLRRLFIAERRNELLLMKISWNIASTTQAIKDAFLNNIQNEFGFDKETTEIMWQLYSALREHDPKASQLELDWQFTRLLGGLKYDEGNGQLKWNKTAGCALPSETSEKEYFVEVLGIEESDYLLLRYKVRIQHDIVGDSKGTMSQLNENQIKIFKKTCEEMTGFKYTDDEFLEMWKKQYKSFAEKGDFAHQQITTSAILGEKINKDRFLSNFGGLTQWPPSGYWSDETVVEKAGWLGDATLGKPPSFGPDDYIADLDSKNISTYMMKRDISYMEAANQYYGDIADGQSRAAIFLKDTPLSEIKQKIYTDLVNPPILRSNDSYAMKKIKEIAPDTYRFIKSLEEEAQIMTEDVR